jgi:hypothetical protein
MALTSGTTFKDTSGNNYKVVLADDFSAGYKAANWGSAFNGGTYWNGAFSWSSADVAVRSGEMQVTDTRHADGSWTAGGFSSFKAGNTITYGTVEFDARVEAAQGTQAAILMWPASDAWPRDGEIDILEAPGNEAMHSSHWEGSDGSHMWDSVFSTFDPSQTHHYKMTWLPASLTIEIDNTVVARWTDAAQIPDTAMGFGAMGYVASAGEAWLGGAPTAATPSTVTTHLDNVVMSQWTGGSGIYNGGVTPPKPLITTLGNGADTLVLKISQDAWQGSATYTISVDGKQIGGLQTASASHASGQDDLITVKGNWDAGSHKVSVNFTNDAYGGSATADRNLHVDGITFNGTAVTGGVADLMSSGPANFAFIKAAPVVTPPKPFTTTLGSGADTLVLKLSQDAWQGSATYTISVDGKQIGGLQTASAWHSAGQDDLITVKGNWGAGSHKVSVNFTNDAYGGTVTADRNLHVDGITFNGKALTGSTADLMSSGPVDFAFSKAGAGTATPPASFGSGAAEVSIGQVNYGGSNYLTFGGTSDWGTGPGAKLAPTSWNPNWSTKLAFDNFVQTTLDLSKAGSTDLMLVSEKRGSVTLGAGDDHVTWVAHSNTNTHGNTMVINTGAGNDVVTVTTAGLSPLADYDRVDNGKMYNASYDGRYSTADVTFGTGHDTVTVAGKVQLLLHAGSGTATATGGAGNDIFHAGSGTANFTGGLGRDSYIFTPGDGHVVIQDFTAGADILSFTGGLTKAGITTKAATEGGVAGLLVTYDAAGDSVFLAHATKLAASDMLFA